MGEVMPAICSLRNCLTVGLLIVLSSLAAIGAEPDDYYREGELAGSLKTSEPLPIYDEDAQHLWNRLFAAFYTRTSNLASNSGGRQIKRIDGPRQGIGVIERPAVGAEGRAIGDHITGVHGLPAVPRLKAVKRAGRLDFRIVHGSSPQPALGINLAVVGAIAG